jgi:hypothetical protein
MKMNSAYDLGYNNPDIENPFLPTTKEAMFFEAGQSARKRENKMNNRIMNE